MRWISNIVSWIADFTGTLTFIALYNIGTVIWVWMGETIPWFPDKWPYNGYTGLVSWLAINTASFILFRDRRREKKELARELQDSKNLEAIKAAVEAQEDNMKLNKQIAQNQLLILEMLRDSEQIGFHAKTKIGE